MEIIQEIFGSDIFGKLLVGGLAAATALLSYFARQIIKNQQDLILIHIALQNLTKEVEGLKKNLSDAELAVRKYDQQQKIAHEKISVDFDMLKALLEMTVKPWDGED